MISDSPNWYPIYTQPRAEKKAFETLASKGIKTYLPLRRTLKQWSDRKKWVEEPLISSYLFVNISAHQQADVLNTRGVSRFIYFSGKIANIPDKQIKALQALLTSETDFEIVERNFKAGQKVEVVTGPLKGVSGELIEIHSEKKLLIRIGTMSSSILVHVPSSVLQHVD